MILDLEGSKEYDKNDSIVRIDKKRLPEWVDTCERGFNKSVNCPIFDILINDKNCMFFGYIADGRIVSTALLNICGANGGIHEVATLESHRNRGCATELIKHIINEGKKSGCEILTLQASVYGEPVYKKLGFKPVSQIYNYMP